MINTINLTAGQRVEFREPGDFFRVLAATAVLTVEFYENGREIAEAVGIGAGYAEKFERGTFDRIAITSATAQTVQFVTRLGNTVQYDAPPTGDVTISGQQGPFEQYQRTVTNAHTVIMVARPNRRYLMVQNKSETGTIYVNVSGMLAEIGNGIRLNPGDSYELQGYVSNEGIMAIGDIASNPDVVVVEA